jgi:hypothetical protein
MFEQPVDVIHFWSTTVSEHRETCLTTTACRRVFFKPAEIFVLHCNYDNYREAVAQFRRLDVTSDHGDRGSVLDGILGR